MDYLYNSAGQKNLRQKLRNGLGLPEIILWGELKGSKLGKKFRRQYGVGKYSLDFYCPELRLGIELDGATHDDPNSYGDDRERENFIISQGIKIIRFQNKDVLKNLNEVVEEIKKSLPPRLAPRDTPPVPGGGQQTPKSVI
jgi:very-short-patch-repair endonuclease